MQSHIDPNAKLAKSFKIGIWKRGYNPTSFLYLKALLTYVENQSWSPVVVVVRLSVHVHFNLDLSPRDS